MSENKAGQASSPITIETASVAAKQYEAASQQLQTLQSQAAVMDANIRSLQGRTGRSGVRSTQTNQEIARLKKERQQLNLGIRSAQNTMQASDKSVRGYYDQEVAKQPAVQALAKAGKRPQDFAQAEFQLKNLRMQYPDMSTMPAEAKKQLKEAMAIIQAGR
jgi:chromosome segregation ATPase